MAYELELLIVVAIGFLAAYLRGSYVNRKRLHNLARLIHDSMSRDWKVGFRPFGHSGLRIKCSTEDKGRQFKSLEMSVTLVDRENLMHYVLTPFTRDRDRFMVWASLNRPIMLDIELFPMKYKAADDPAKEKYLEEVSQLGSTLSPCYKAYSNSNQLASRILTVPEVQNSLSHLSGHMQRVSVKSQDSLVYMTANLEKEEIMPLIECVLTIGDAITHTVKG